ncbi:hypothetical protein NL108_009783 [Boleophthalmus pectinirostris]|uniref:zinc finger and SCAN domain-containing protein 12-like n=1 Tax=Boleophthalmus pectinirostris TaxID=150288 RepID=UPI00242F0EAA|nr:zinc finger and SCAN domain-containing protein 12-like [Boleophthalmus pectinirostris]KAJ0044135.1 hypothetical protein NL108_009783 [Boleophthalmus pectinirostris]
MSQNQQISTMFTVQGMRKFVCDRLTEVAQEILGAFEKRAQEYELELDRQRRLLESFYAEANVGRTGSSIKEESHNIGITESDLPIASTSVQGVHSESQSSKEVQNAERMQPERACSPHQENTSSKHIKCSHGYRLPKRFVPRQHNTNKDNGKISSSAPPPVEIIEIEDNSPVSSDVEVMQEDKEPTTSQKMSEISHNEKQITHANKNSSATEESKTPKLKCGKKNSPPHSHTPALDNNAEAMETETTTDNMENEPTTCLPTANLDSIEWSEPIETEENTALPDDVNQNKELVCEDSTSKKTDDKLLHKNCKDDQSAKEISNNTSDSNDPTCSTMLHVSTAETITNKDVTDCTASTSEQPYKCNWCNKRFVNRTTLKHHTRIHTGVNPYECSICHKSFATNIDMKVHFKIHSGERPYRCDQCGKDFSSWTNYNRHTRIHKPTEPQ